MDVQEFLDALERGGAVFVGGVEVFSADMVEARARTEARMARADGVEKAVLVLMEFIPPAKRGDAVDALQRLLGEQ